MPHNNPEHGRIHFICGGRLRSRNINPFMFYFVTPVNGEFQFGHTWSCRWSEYRHRRGSHTQKSQYVSAISKTHKNFEKELSEISHKTLKIYILLVNNDQELKRSEGSNDVMQLRKTLGQNSLYRDKMYSDEAQRMSRLLHQYFMHICRIKNRGICNSFPVTNENANLFFRR